MTEFHASNAINFSDNSFYSTLNPLWMNGDFLTFELDFDVNSLSSYEPVSVLANFEKKELRKIRSKISLIDRDPHLKSNKYPSYLVSRFMIESENTPEEEKLEDIGDNEIKIDLNSIFSEKDEEIKIKTIRAMTTISLDQMIIFAQTENDMEQIFITKKSSTNEERLSFIGRYTFLNDLGNIIKEPDYSGIVKTGNRRKHLIYFSKEKTFKILETIAILSKTDNLDFKTNLIYENINYDFEMDFYLTEIQISPKEDNPFIYCSGRSKIMIIDKTLKENNSYTGHYPKRDPDKNIYFYSLDFSNISGELIIFHQTSNDDQPVTVIGKIDSSFINEYLKIDQFKYQGKTMVGKKNIALVGTEDFISLFHPVGEPQNCRIYFISTTAVTAGNTGDIAVSIPIYDHTDYFTRNNIPYTPGFKSAYGSNLLDIIPYSDNKAYMVVTYFPDKPEKGLIPMLTWLESCHEACLGCYEKGRENCNICKGFIKPSNNDCKYEQKEDPKNCSDKIIPGCEKCLSETEYCEKCEKGFSGTRYNRNKTGFEECVPCSVANCEDCEIENFGEKRKCKKCAKNYNQLKNLYSLQVCESQYGKKILLRLVKVSVLFMLLLSIIKF